VCIPATERAFGHAKLCPPRFPKPRLGLSAGRLRRGLVTRAVRHTSTGSATCKTVPRWGAWSAAIRRLTPSLPGNGRGAHPSRWSTRTSLTRAGGIVALGERRTCEAKQERRESRCRSTRARHAAFKVLRAATVATSGEGAVPGTNTGLFATRPVVLSADARKSGTAASRGPRFTSLRYGADRPYGQALSFLP
jgi:hypothetical protein